MKPFNLIFIYALLFIACYSDDDVLVSETLLDTEATIQMRAAGHPYNLTNAYDFAGQVHSDIFNSYYDLPLLPSALDSIVSLVEAQMSHHDYFKALPNYNYHQFSSAYFDSIIKQPVISLANALGASPLSSPAKDSLEIFINTLFLKVNAEEDYDLIYDFIIAYETFSLEAKDYTDDESAFILLVTSIARHSIYNKDKRPKPNTDPDWDWLTTCIVGSVNGAVYSVPESIAMALKSGIASP